MPIRIPVFSAVIAIDNFIVRALSMGSSPYSRTRAILRETNDKDGLPGDPDVAANVEEGRRVGRTARKMG